MFNRLLTHQNLDSSWVDWFNHRRLLEPIGNIPPAEVEANHHAAMQSFAMAT